MRAEIASYTEPGWTQRLPERIARKRSCRSVQFMVSRPQRFSGWFLAGSAYHGRRRVKGFIVIARSGATKQSRSAPSPSARDCFVAIAMTVRREEIMEKRI